LPCINATIKTKEKQRKRKDEAMPATRPTPGSNSPIPIIISTNGRENPKTVEILIEEIPNPRTVSVVDLLLVTFANPAMMSMLAKVIRETKSTMIRISIGIIFLSSDSKFSKTD